MYKNKFSARYTDRHTVISSVTSFSEYLLPQLDN